MNKKLLISILTIFAVGALTYFNSFYGTYVFDDERHILYNPAIRSLWPPWPSMFSPLNVSRPLVGLSLAINYAMGEYDTFHYHLFNLIIHLLSALAILGVVRRLCLTNKVPEWCQKFSLEIAVTSALLWTAHPLNLQAVTYLTQRFQSMMGLFYFFSVYLAIRYMQNQEPDQNSPQKPFYKDKWLMSTTLAAICGMLCKQDMVTAPFAILALDRLFFSPSLKQALKNHRSMYVGLILSLIILVIFNQFGPPRAFAGFGNSFVIPMNYAMTQLEVITKYIGLAFLLLPTTFDYRLMPVTAITEVIPELFFILALVGATIWLYLRKNKLSLAGIWFFFGLAVTSSFFPIADAICEYRMYVPLASITTLVALGLWKLTALQKMPRALTLSLILIATALIGLRTHHENKIFYSQLDLWKDVTVKRPLNPRAWNNVGILIERTGNVTEAHEMYKKAYAADPYYIGGVESMGRMALKNRDYDKADTFFKEAIRISPHYGDPYYQLGKLNMILGRKEQAIPLFQKAIELDPYFVDAYSAYGVLLLNNGQAKDAIPLLAKAAQYDPRNPDFYFNLGTAQAVVENFAEAKNNLTKAVQLNPYHTPAQKNLAVIAKRESERKPSNQ